MDAEVILFPSDKIVREPDISPEKMRDEIEMRTQLMRTFHVQEVVEALMPIVFGQLAIGGFDLSDEADVKDAAFITEAIRSVLCKHKGIVHPFQQLADSIFVDEEEGVLSIVDKLDISFLNKSEKQNEFSDSRPAANHDCEPDGASQ